MTLSSQLQGTLRTYTDKEVRSLGKKIWLECRIPKEAEMTEVLQPLFSSCRVTSREAKKGMVRYAIALKKRYNLCSDEQGGRNYIYDDGVKVHILSTMSLKTIQAAFMKGRNQARRRRPIKK